MQTELAVSVLALHQFLHQHYCRCHLPHHLKTKIASKAKDVREYIVTVVRAPPEVPHKEVHVTVHLPAADMAHCSGLDVIELVATQRLVPQLRVDVEAYHGGPPRHKRLVVRGANLLGVVYCLF